MMLTYFERIQDPRQGAKVQYKLSETIVLVICAVIAGCDVWEDIADFCRVKETWFRRELGLELRNGIPSHDTMQRLFAMMEPEEFNASFGAWISNTCKKQASESDIRETISIDGKTMRGSQDGERRPIHIVSAWAHEAGIVLGQIATEEKSNEITAVPELLDIIDVEGCVVTADAMSCQKEIVKKIVSKGADYVISLKDNQHSLYTEAVQYLKDAEDGCEGFDPISSVTIEGKGHGRVEKRVYELCTAKDLITLYPAWTGLHAVCKMHSVVTENGITTEADRYYITSLNDVNDLARAARNHWGVENSLHWCLDVTFKEDASRMRKDHSAENFAVIRHMALSVLRNMPDKMSIARRRRRCAYDDAYLALVMLSIHA